MIHKRMYLGIPMSTRRNRRRLVVCYWIVAVLLHAGFTAMLLRVPKLVATWWMTCALAVVYVLLMSFLGGQGGGAQLGPVADFERYAAPPRWAPLEIARRLWRHGTADKRMDRALDERDLRLRDALHYEAYRMLCDYLVPLAFAVVLVFVSDLSRNLLLLIPAGFLLMLLIYTLPQTLILWHEPDMEEPRSTRGAACGNALQGPEGDQP